jgi:hypothetical protein
MHKNTIILVITIILFAIANTNANRNYLQLNTPTTVRFNSKLVDSIKVNDLDYRESHVQRYNHQKQNSNDANLILDLNEGMYCYDSDVEAIPIYNRVYHMDNQDLRDLYIKPHSQRQIYNYDIYDPITTKKLNALVNLQLTELTSPELDVERGPLRMYLLINNVIAMIFNTTSVSSLLEIDFAEKTEIYSVSFVVVNNNEYSVCSCPSISDGGRFMSFWNGESDSQYLNFSKSHISQNIASIGYLQNQNNQNNNTKEDIKILNLEHKTEYGKTWRHDSSKD